MPETGRYVIAPLTGLRINEQLLKTVLKGIQKPVGCRQIFLCQIGPDIDQVLIGSNGA
jgi:hypothetical protein